MSKQTRYVTTPIYYVNDRPHIGHVYTTTLCDVYARAMRQVGHDVFFLTGTDEHGIKVEQSAKEKGVSPQELADVHAAEFQSVMGMFNLSNDDFIRTTDPNHMFQVQAFVSVLLARGDVYLVKVLAPIRLSLVCTSNVVVTYHVQRVSRTGEGCFHLKCPVPKYELFAELGERFNQKWTARWH